jgi:GH24 family phage-related lysozyme (muramidase)
MKNIAPLVINKDYKKIAEQIRSMKRLWIGKNLDGLLTRREKEAKMVEEGLA